MMKRTLLLLLSLPLLASCQYLSMQEPVEEPEPVSCAETRLDVSFEFHSRAKEQLASYYKTRKESELFFAWYASEDSNFMARSVGKCLDKRNKHYHAVQNIFQKNRILRKLIVQNMRQDTQAEISELFLEEYQRIFVRDIR